MNTFGLLLSCSRNVPNTHLMRTSAPGTILRSIYDPRPCSSSLMRKVNRFPTCLTIEYCLVNSHWSSCQTKVTNCHTLDPRRSTLSMMSSMVVGLRNRFETILARSVSCSCHSTYGTKSLLVTPHTGHLQSSGISENSVPAFIPSSSSPRTGS